MILRGDFPSETLKSSANIQFFIPDKGEGTFRVVYLLHGLHGGSGTWLDNTQLPLYAKNYNAVFVMPEASRSFYANQKYGRKFYDFVSEELPRICQSIFNISEKREDTAVMGCSMGGYGALRLALSMPLKFGFCGAIAPACLYFKPLLESLRKDPGPWLKNGAEAEQILTDLYAIHGEELEYRSEYDVVELARNFPSGTPMPKIYAACGTEDDLLKDNQMFNDEMKNSAFEFKYEEWTGGHEWYFFNEALKKALDNW